MEYTWQTWNIGIDVMRYMQSIDMFSTLSTEARRQLRDNATPEVYQMIVSRGKDGYYVSGFYKTLEELGYIKA